MKKVIINIGNRLEKKRRKNKLNIIRGGSCSCGYYDPGCGYSTRGRSETGCGYSSTGCGYEPRRSRIVACGYTEEDLLGCGGLSSRNSRC